MIPIINLKNKGVVYITFLVLTLSLGGDLFFYAARQNVAGQKKDLEVKKARLFSYSRHIASQRKQLLLHKEKLESNLQGLKKEMGVLSAQLGREADNARRSAQESALKAEELVRLNNETARYKEYNKALEDRLLSLSAAHDELASKLSNTRAQKKKSEKKLNTIMNNMANEEAITSLGTVVIGR